VEFANTNYSMEIQALRASYAFASTLKKEDWVAVVSYDMHPEILVDFTQDKTAINQALNGLRMPGFSETWEFQALYDTIDRLERVEGHKYLILVSSGVDTGLRLTLDQIEKVKNSRHNHLHHGISGWFEPCARRVVAPGIHGMASLGISPIDYAQADNEMRTRPAHRRPLLPASDGGRFPGRVPGHRQASPPVPIIYHPTNTKLDGTYRKLKVVLPPTAARAR
jgi:hypothetical protein